MARRTWPQNCQTLAPGNQPIRILRAWPPLIRPGGKPESPSTPRMTCRKFATKFFRLFLEKGDSLRFHAVIADKRILARDEIRKPEFDPKARYEPNSLNIKCQFCFGLEEKPPIEGNTTIRRN